MALLLAVVVSLALVVVGGLTVWNSLHLEREGEVKPGQRNVVTSADGKVTVEIPGGAIRSAGTLTIAPTKEDGHKGWSIELRGTKLVGEATIRFKIPHLEAGEPTPLATFTTAGDDRRQVAHDQVREGDELVVQTDHFSNWFVDRWNDLLNTATKWLADRLDQAASVSEDQAPRCEGEDGARKQYDVTSDKGSRVYWCFGIEGGQPVLKALNARGYGVAAEYTPGLTRTYTDNKDFIGHIATLLTPAPTKQGNSVELLGSGKRLELSLDESTPVAGVKLSPDPGAYLLSALDFGISTVTMVWERTGLGDSVDKLLAALEGEQCLQSFSQLATTELTSAAAAQEFFTNALKTALDCVKVAAESVDVGWINEVIVGGVIWLIGGLKTAVDGIVAAADLGFDVDGYQIVVTKQDQAPSPGGESSEGDGTTSSTLAGKSYYGFAGIWFLSNNTGVMRYGDVTCSPGSGGTAEAPGACPGELSFNYSFDDDGKSLTLDVQGNRYAEPSTTDSLASGESLRSLVPGDQITLGTEPEGSGSFPSVMVVTGIRAARPDGIDRGDITQAACDESWSHCQFNNLGLDVLIQQL